MSEPRRYNLLEKQWIPVVWRSDATGETPQKVNIREALARSPEIRCISHTSPFIEFGLYRLLITIVLDAYTVAGRRPTIGKMKAMLEDGQFDDSVLRPYFDRYRPGFELWGQDNPFMQVPTQIGKDDYICNMVAPVPSGTKVAFWHHFTEDETGLTEDQAAQELCAVAPFCFDYAPRDVCSLSGDPPLYVLVQGESLFQTVVHNLPRLSGRLSAGQEMQGGPTWRSLVEDPSAVPRAPTYPQGWTWPVRQIRFVYDDSDPSLIRKAVNIAGAGKTETRGRVRGWRDPNAGTLAGSDGLRHLRAGDFLPRHTKSGDCSPTAFTRDLIPLCLVSSE